MTFGFLDHMRVVPDHRIPGMVTYPLDEILLATLAGVVCGADDWEGVEEIATGGLDWLRGFLPFANGIPTAQTLRKVFRLLDAQALERGFAAWAASMRVAAREVIAVDGKTLRGSKTSSDGKGALHLVSAYATEAGLVLAQRAVDGKSNEITAIPELLDMLNLKGAIVSIDAMGTQKEIAQRIVDKGADYVLALKGNQASLHEDAALFFADPVCAATCARSAETDAGHGRIEERIMPRRRGKLARQAPPRLERPALARRRHRPAHRQEDRRRKPRDPLLHHFPRTRPQRHSRRRARPLGHREQSSLDDGRDFRRRPLPNQKRRFAVEFRHHPPHRIQHPQSGSNARLPPTQTPPSLHRPNLPLQPLRRLTI